MLWRWLIAVGWVMLAIGCPGQGMAAGDAGPPAKTFSRDDEIILELHVGREDLTGTIIGYQVDDKVYLPVQRLSQMLEYKIDLDPINEAIGGWIENEKDQVALNGKAGLATRAGQAIATEPGQIVAFRGDIYVRQDLLMRIFGFSLRIDLEALTLTLQSARPFPVQLRMERDRQLKSLSRTAPGPSREEPLEGAPTPWSIATVPLIDAGVNLSLAQQKLLSQVDLRSASDLAFLSARSFGTFSSRDGLSSLSLELGRRSAKGDLLGPLGASSFALGDTFLPSLSIGPAAVRGRGMVVMNTPLNRGSLFQTTELRGELPVGWQVELWRNGTFLAVTGDAVDGRYAFNQVELLYGSNLFRLIFYGPHGEKREEIRRINVGQGLVPRHALQYRAGAVQVDSTLFSIQPSYYVPLQEARKLQAFVEAQYGLSSKWTGLLTLARFPVMDGERWMGAAGLRTNVLGASLAVDGAVQAAHGAALSTALAGRLGTYSFLVRHAEYVGDFRDMANGRTTDAMARISELTSSGALRLARLSLPITVGLRQTIRANGNGDVNGVFRTSYYRQNVVISQRFSLSHLTQIGTATTTILSGSTEAYWRGASGMGLRSLISYDMAPRPVMSSATIEANHRFSPTSSALIATTYLPDSQQISLDGAFQKVFNAVRAAVSLSYQPGRQDITAMMRIGFSFTRDPTNGRAFFNDGEFGSNGVAMARVYDDANANGRLDQGEALLNHIGVQIGNQSGQSDAQGRFINSRSPDGLAQRVEIDPDRMPDFSLAPTSPHVVITTRAGRVNVVDLGLAHTSDIILKVLFRADDKTREVSAVRLELQSEDGRFTRQAISDELGIALFEGMVPGRYQLRLEADQAKRLGLRLLGEGAIVIARDQRSQSKTIEIIRQTP